MTAKAIGRFEVDRELGRGAQGVVYLARDPRLDRLVAIKTLRTISVAQSDNLLREARTVSNLQHPNIIPLYDLGSHEGGPYLVYAYIKGETVAQVLKRSGPLSMANAARIVADVLDALATAHGQGIMHLDIKPGNVRVPFHSYLIILAASPVRRNIWHRKPFPRRARNSAPIFFPWA
jgi:serine/threonine protein kinase